MYKHDPMAIASNHCIMISSYKFEVLSVMVFFTMMRASRFKFNGKSFDDHHEGSLHHGYKHNGWEPFHDERWGISAGPVLLSLRHLDSMVLLVMCDGGAMVGPGSMHDGAIMWHVSQKIGGRVSLHHMHLVHRELLPYMLEEINDVLRFHDSHWSWFFCDQWTCFKLPLEIWSQSSISNPMASIQT